MDGNNEQRVGQAQSGVHGEPDSNGQAALLLIESLFRTLVEHGILSSIEILDTVQVATEVKRDLAESTGESRERTDESLSLLDAIDRSFVAYDGNPGQ